jgi:hypothetical protein
MAPCAVKRQYAEPTCRRGSVVKGHLNGKEAQVLTATGGFSTDNLATQHIDFQPCPSVVTKLSVFYREIFDGQESKGTTHLDSRTRPRSENDGPPKKARLSNCQGAKAERRSNEAKSF